MTSGFSLAIASRSAASGSGSKQRSRTATSWRSRAAPATQRTPSGTTGDGSASRFAETRSTRTGLHDTNQSPNLNAGGWIARSTAADRHFDADVEVHLVAVLEQARLAAIRFVRLPLRRSQLVHVRPAGAAEIEERMAATVRGDDEMAARQDGEGKNHVAPGGAPERDGSVIEQNDELSATITNDADVLFVHARGRVWFSGPSDVDEGPHGA